MVCYKEREGEVNSLTFLLFESTDTKTKRLNGMGKKVKQPALCKL